MSLAYSPKLTEFALAQSLRTACPSPFLSLFRLGASSISSGTSLFLLSCQALVVCLRPLHQPRRRCRCRRRQRKGQACLSPFCHGVVTAKPTRPPHTCGRTKGGGFVVDLPYQMHNNYESGEREIARGPMMPRERGPARQECQVSRVVLRVPPYADRILPVNSKFKSQAYRSCSASLHQNQNYS